MKNTENTVRFTGNIPTLVTLNSELNMFKTYRIASPLPGMLRLAASGAGIPGFPTYLRAIKLAKECRHLLGPAWATPNIAALAKRPLETPQLAATDTRIARPPHHRPTLRLVKG